MELENAIEVRNIKKTFKLYEDKPTQLKDMFVYHNFRKARRKEIIKGISFDVRRGQAIGLIGKNGCGKSTTLKMLTRILFPDEGEIEINGRVASLIELGAGFHPDMTGRENIYINASIFGIRAKEVDKRMDDIIRFSELEEYIDSPVRTYSSGMYMRLAFSVAINVDADVLLIDEILAVGDSAFQKKCFNKMHKLKESGVTIVLVSHSLGQVQDICDETIWIDNGLIREQGRPDTICMHYTKAMENARREREKIEKEQVLKQHNENGNNFGKNSEFFFLDEDREDVFEIHNDFTSCQRTDLKNVSGSVKINSLDILDRNNNIIEVGERIKVKLTYDLLQEKEDVYFRCVIIKLGGNPAGVAMSIEPLKSSGNVAFEIDTSQVAPGKYMVTLVLFNTDKEGNDKRLDVIKNAFGFEVVSTKGRFFNYEWPMGWGNNAYPDIKFE